MFTTQISDNGHVGIRRQVRAKLQGQDLRGVSRSKGGEDAPWKTERLLVNGLFRKDDVRENSPAERLTDDLQLNGHTKNGDEDKSRHHDQTNDEHPSETKSLDQVPVEQCLQRSAQHDPLL